MVTGCGSVMADSGGTYDTALEELAVVRDYEVSSGVADMGRGRGGERGTAGVERKA
jgi:hypothetical protein